MIKSISILLDENNTYANPAMKVRRMVDSGVLFPVVRGLYETDAETPGYCLASAIYGPSYLSFEFALAYHSLIPEAVRVFTCATFEKKKRKIYKTLFGTFTYRDVPSAAYPYGVKLKSENGYSIAIATPEKALCDLLYTISPAGNTGELESLLFDDLRIGRDGFGNLNKEELSELAGLYCTKNHRLLQSFIRRKLYE